MRWECPFEARRRHQCRLFDARCEPGSDGCLLNETPGFEPLDDERFMTRPPDLHERPVRREWVPRRARATKSA